MANKVLILVVLALFTVALVGCVTHTHIVGKGAPTNGKKVEQRQWYAVWGFVDINKVDTAKMAGDASDYTIKTRYNVIDAVVSWLLGGFSIYSRTVTVIK
ncbi:MAG: hypothetical protein HY811_01620 [Planctomycetes bacterium]|nr:hypothetical protein [Planctomycetota bacterium]